MILLKSLFKKLFFLRIPAILESMDKWLIDNPRKEFFLERKKINKTFAVKLPIWSERISWVTTNSKCHLYLCPRKFVQVLIPNEIILIKVWRDFLKHSNCWSALTRTLSVRNATVSERNNLISRKYCEFLQKMITSIVMCNAKGNEPLLPLRNNHETKCLNETSLETHSKATDIRCRNSSRSIKNPIIGKSLVISSDNA